MTDFGEIPEFSKDLKKLYKKFRSIYDDLEAFKKALASELPNHLSGTVQISNLGRDVKTPIYKVRHFRCKALKGKGSRSGIRVIYAYEQDKALVTLIEVYHKSKQENENRERILKYFT
jgi:mRNA-degrading endonuclease RelE of RelBE toxin-antitoxin system